MLLLCLLGLASTLPLALPRPLARRRRDHAAGVLSLAAFDVLTVAGMVAQLVGGLPPRSASGRRRPRCFGLPYLVLATRRRSRFTGHRASCSPAWCRSRSGSASPCGCARTPPTAGRCSDAFVGTLLEHTARGERARIARELHDVVAHHISMIAVQAETARLTDPGHAGGRGKRLSAIGDTARAALTEMRRLLGVLREDADEPARRSGDRNRGLRQLNELLDEARDATGAGTRLILTGRPVPLDPGVELAAYRIVQEALTNSRRHAPARRSTSSWITGRRAANADPGQRPGSCAAGGAGGHGLTGHARTGRGGRWAAAQRTEQVRRVPGRGQSCRSVSETWS